MAKEKVSSILRAMRILECFTDHKAERTLKNITKQLDMPSATVYRQLSTLSDSQYLVQDSVCKSYQAGPRLMHLAASIWSQSDLRCLARPELECLRDTIQETIHLSMLLDHDIFYLDKVEAPRSTVCGTRIGCRMPAYAASSGKAILANQSETDIDGFCLWMASNAQSLTEHTITDPERLREELAVVRRRGYATDDRGIEMGLICYGAPVYDTNQKAVAAVSVSGPEFRMMEAKERIVQEVQKTAENISRLLSYMHAR